MDTPILALVEAKIKKIVSGLGQCVVEMIAAKLLHKESEEDCRNIRTHDQIVSATICCSVIVQTPSHGPIPLREGVNGYGVGVEQEKFV